MLHGPSGASCIDTARARCSARLAVNFPTTFASVTSAFGECLPDECYCFNAIRVRVRIDRIAIQIERVTSRILDRMRMFFHAQMLPNRGHRVTRYIIIAEIHDRLPFLQIVVAYAPMPWHCLVTETDNGR